MEDGALLYSQSTNFNVNSQKKTTFTVTPGQTLESSLARLTHKMNHHGVETKQYGFPVKTFIGSTDI